MPATTPRLLLPYPIPDDTVDVPRDVQALADKLDVVVPTLPGAPALAQTPYNTGATYSSSNNTLVGGSLPGVVTSGKGCVICTLSGFAQNDGTNGTRFVHHIALRIDSVFKGTFGIVGTNLQGDQSPIGCAIPVLGLSAAPHLFECYCASGVNATWSLRNWQFSVVEVN